MQKVLVVFATVMVGLAAAHHGAPVVTADKSYVTKQKSIYQLYWHVDQPTTVLPELYQKARTFSIADHLDSYTNQVAVQEFLDLWKHGMIPREEIFSVFYPHHLEEAKALFNVFYYAKDFNTFYNTAVWARFNVNEKLFSYALSVAVIHRPDTKFIKLPPLYEIMPHYFFNNEVIQQAYHIKMGDVSGVKKGVNIKYHEGGVNDIVINANYSGWYMSHDYHSEEKLTYFTEDVGLNSFYFYFKHEFPFWISSTDLQLPTNLRGEVYFYGHKTLLTRYYLERLSNGLGEIEYIDWHKPIVPGFHPSIVHPNGLPFPHRPSWSEIPVYKYPYVHDVEDIENYISLAIDAGFLLDSKHNHVDIYTPEGFNMLANVIEGNADSINYRLYNSLDHTCKKILGFNLEPVHKYQIVPSALETFTTSLRDPAFYRIYKKIVNYLLKFKANLPTYTHDQLVFPGVKIESIAVDKLTTFFDHFDSEISNALPVTSHKEAQNLNVKVRQHRLNHKPFTYHITINSDKNVKSMIRIFLGPKYDVHGHELDMTENWVNFMELDQWVVDLKTGVNKIERSNHASQYVFPDEVTGSMFYKKIEKAVETGEQFTYSQQLYGFPDRLVLPKGKKEGMPFKLFVFVSPIDENVMHTIETPVWGTTVVDGHPLGYPLDRPIKSHVFNPQHVPNMFYKDVMIYHKHAEELNLTV
ncbi:larval serum protein 1 alpha chain-like [Venturia canescens]|uniref:larval serum protein 1 alpha chain-like n=1 Tax=Venturia canescens TaxID=32260 RepID=UPI001C9C6C8A|nr:larval serum protein 1 alpha chain-like [Venturia canescens]